MAIIIVTVYLPLAGTWSAPIAERRLSVTIRLIDHNKKNADNLLTFLYCYLFGGFCFFFRVGNADDYDDCLMRIHYGCSFYYYYVDGTQKYKYINVIKHIEFDSIKLSNWLYLCARSRKANNIFN